MGEKITRVFISYSWEDDEHKAWVRSLADKLLARGIDATVDQYDLALGDRLPQFMEQAVTNADYVLIICTPTYKKKSDSREGGVGYEGHIITGELLVKGNERKFIPVIRKGNISSAIPTSLAGKLAIDLTKEGLHYDTNFENLVTTLLNKVSKKPPVNRMSQTNNLPLLARTEAMDDDTVRVLGIVTDKVTIPQMDGTRGSALHKIPFRLSKTPSSLWQKLFVQTWNNPPRFSTMHRPGIASVYGDEIILNGTTIEEVRDYHRETLLLCVDEANKKEKEIHEAEQRTKERDEALKKQHYTKINNIAKIITF